jgi:hypothetical protein
MSIWLSGVAPSSGKSDVYDITLIREEYSDGVISRLFQLPSGDLQYAQTWLPLVVLARSKAQKILSSKQKNGCATLHGAKQETYPDEIKLRYVGYYGAVKIKVSLA